MDEMGEQEKNQPSERPVRRLPHREKKNPDKSLAR
jgi:hypothetical protein